MAASNASCHSAGGTHVREGAEAVVLVGNPNVGKSVVFNALTGTYVDVSNFPGTTVELTRGRLGEHDVVDTPGVYGVSSFTDEETVARDIILSGDIVVNVVDSAHLERDLFLTLQLADMGKRMVVALNMADEARHQGVGIDRDLLEDLLGVPVVETVAVEGEGIAELKAAIPRARVGHADPELAPVLAETAERLGCSRAEALLVLEGDEAVSERLGAEPGGERDAIYLRRRARVDDMCGHVVTESLQGASFSAKLSHAMMHPLTGIPMLLVLLGAIYVVIGKLVAGNLVGFLQGTLMEGHYIPWVQGLVGHLAAPNSAVFEVLAGQFGLLTMAPSTLLGVILPLVTAFYLLLSLLEDSGYLLRIATLTDRILVSMGLNGRAVIPFILGLGCVTMGTLSTRVLGSRRERFIATALMAVTVPCSAQLAIVAALMTTAAPIYTVAYFAILAAVFIALGTLLHKLVPGQSSDLLIDLPPLRLPRVDNMLRKTGIKAWGFMREVTMFFAVGTLVLGLLKVTGALGWITTAAAPLMTGWLGLPRETATAFVMGMIRRDFGAAGFFSMDLTSPQLLVAMVTITLFVPCIASTVVVLKERGWRYMFGLVAGSTGFAVLLGGVIAHVLRIA
ncbi:MAG: ferrous iron transport protein B [Coriobacteriia bacterium]|nr:ferrous iron transport protein B [Coriobacteriia bacterium]